MAVSVGVHALALIGAAGQAPRLQPAGRVVEVSLATTAPAGDRPGLVDHAAPPPLAPVREAAAGARAQTPPDPAPVARPEQTPARPASEAPRPPPRPAIEAPAPAQAAAPAPSTPAPPGRAPGAATEPAPSSEELQRRLRERLELSLRAHFTYPPMARRYGWEGRVEVGLRVEANGELSGLHVVRTSGHGVLDRAAVATLSRVTRLPEAVEWLRGRHFDMVLPIRYRLVDG